MGAPCCRRPFARPSEDPSPPTHCGYLNEMSLTLAMKISMARPRSNPPCRSGADRFDRRAPRASKARAVALHYSALSKIMSDSPLREPRWPAFIAMLAASGVYLALPEPLSVGPSWLLLAIMVLLMIPIAISNRRGDYKVTRVLTFTGNALITLAMIASLGLLVQGIPRHLESPQALLRSAIALWVTNVLIFALWYWKLDCGGPVRRERRQGSMANNGFLFPQMMGREGRDSAWTPHFVDYLFLAFNTSTAFSPTDTAVLARWAKLLTMLQSLISLTIIALLAARAVNIL